MSSDYDWDISKQATERILLLPKSQREELILLFDQLAGNLEASAINQFTDSGGTLFHIAALGNKTITYHVDHPVKLVHIIAIE